MDWDNFICIECGYNMYKTREVIFKDNSKHLEARCDRCDKYIGYAPQELEGNGEDHIFHFGKHKGLTIKEIYEKDPGYIQWAANEIDGKPGFAAKTYLNWLDTDKILN